MHVTAKCANCGGNHIADSALCISRYKADLEVRKHKKEKTQDKSQAENTRMEKTLELEREHREESLLTDTDMELGSGDWTQYAEVKEPEFFDDESQNHSKNH